MAVGAPYLQAEWKDASRKQSSFLGNEIHIRQLLPLNFVHSTRVFKRAFRKFEWIGIFSLLEKTLQGKTTDTSSVHEAMLSASPFLLVTHLHPQTSLFAASSLMRASSLNTFTKNSIQGMLHATLNTTLTKHCRCVHLCLALCNSPLYMKTRNRCVHPLPSPPTTTALGASAQFPPKARFGSAHDH